MPQLASKSPNHHITSYHGPVLDKLRAQICEHGLMSAGDRVAVAVSGGADSVGLLRALLELRGELGVVVSGAHFNHRIRGTEADADQQFVAALACEHGLECHLASGDAPAEAGSRRLSLETAARELRYRFFRGLLAEKKVDKVATAHTLDDQSETVLMRLVRGAGTKGLAGIYPAQKFEEGWVIRPMLGIRRHEVEQYLRAAGQTWREDASNRDLRHLRNRVRHQLLPLLEREFNPAIAEVLATTAQIAREDEEHWQNEMARYLPIVYTPTRLGGVVTLEHFEQRSLASQRRLLRAAARELGIQLDFEHVDELLRLALPKPAAAKSTTGKAVELPGGWRAVRDYAELRFDRPAERERVPDYLYRLGVPGEVCVSEVSSVIRARPGGGAGALDARRLAPELVVRNRRPGDRLWPAHSRAPKKIKELLQEMQVPKDERALWPVALSGETIVWMRGLCVAVHGMAADGEGIVIEEAELPPA